MATTNIVSTLGAGSGIDIKKLAEDLVAAERAPRQELLDQRVARAARHGCRATAWCATACRR